MKKILFPLLAILALLFLASCNPAATATGLGTVSISFNMKVPTLMSSVGNDESVLVWVVDAQNTYVATLEYYHSWSDSGYGLVGEGVTSAWTNARSGNVDGVASATVHLTSSNSPFVWTLGAHTTTLAAPTSWDCLDAAGVAVAAGTYTVKIAVLRRSNGTLSSRNLNYFLHTVPVTVGTTASSASIPSTALDTSGNTGEDPSVVTGNGGTITFTPL